MFNTYLRHLLTSTMFYLFRRAFLSWLFLVTGLLISALAHWTTSRLIEQEEYTRFNLRVEQGRAAIERNLVANAEVVRALQSHFTSSSDYDRHRFRSYYSSLELKQRYPGLRALTFSRWLRPEQVNDYVGRKQADRSFDLKGLPEFSIKPGGQRDFYCVVDLLEPLEDYPQPLGFDLCSEPNRRSMVERARDTGELTSSGPLKLHLPAQTVHGFILALPIYSSDTKPNTENDRRRTFLGVVTSVYRYHELVEGALGDTFLKEVEVSAYDLPSDASAPHDGAQAIFGENARSTKLPTVQNKLMIGGRTWVFTFSPRTDFYTYSDRILPTLVTIIGLLVTFSVFAALRLLLVMSRRAENRALVSEQRLASVVAALPDLIWSIGLPGYTLQYLSPIASSLLGPELSARALGQKWQNLVREADQELVATWLDVILNGGSEVLELCIAQADGKMRWLQLRANVAVDENNLPIRIDGIASDISARITAESHLRKLSAVVEQSPVAVVITDINGHIEYVNPRYCQLTGYTLEDVLGKTPSVNASGLTSNEAYAKLWETILAGGIWQGEIQNRRKDGELFWELEVIAPVFDSKGRICNFVAIKEDITEKKRAEAELQRINRTLRVLSRCNAVLVRASSEADILEAMCDVLVEHGGYQMVLIGRPMPDYTLRVATQRGFDTQTLTELITAARWDESPGGNFPSGRAMRTAKVIVERRSDMKMQDPWFLIHKEKNIRTIVSLPLSAGGEVLGVLSLFSVDASAFDTAELALLSELADDLAYGIGNLRSECLRRTAVSQLLLMRRAIDASSDGIMVAEHRSDELPLVYVNHAFEQITGFVASEAMGKNLTFLYAPEARENSLRELNDMIKVGREGRMELHIARKDGQLLWGEIAIAPVLEPDGQISHVIGVLTDISERKTWEAQLEYQATHDALTELPNRLLMADRVNRAIAAARRDQSNVVLMLLDLNRFKLVNDSLGHEVGDQLLKSIAMRLVKHIREGDTVARLGGDEFVIVANVHDEHGAASLATTLIQAITEPIVVDGHTFYVTSSAGLAMFPRDGEDLPILLRNADAAMYRAKAEGSNLPQFYSQNLTISTGRRLQLESALRQALEREELYLHFQPKIRLDTGMLTGAEVLLRWQHPEFGAVSPAEFIPIAEDTGLILPIGDWVLRETCQQISRWLALDLPVVPLAVNLSARQFSSANFVEQIERILQETNVDASFLHLELTESILVHRPDSAASMLRRLRALGIKLALDDFGTGFSSLNYLRRFPIDLLKIDQSFITELVRDPDSATIALSIINLAHSLRMEVIAEGVETEAQLTFLRLHGCDQVQGYLTGRPVPTKEFEDMLMNARKPVFSEQTTANKRTLLLLDDEPNVLNALRRVFAHEGYQLLTTTSAYEALEILAMHRIGVILSDERMPEMSGSAFFRRVKIIYPDTVRMILSGYTDLDTVAGAVNEGAIYKFLTKPWENDQLREHVRDAFRYHELIQERGRQTDASGQ